MSVWRCAPPPQSHPAPGVDKEVAASEQSALECVLSVDHEKAHLEAEADLLLGNTNPEGVRGRARVRMCVWVSGVCVSAPNPPPPPGARVVCDPSKAPEGASEYP